MRDRGLEAVVLVDAVDVGQRVQADVEQRLTVGHVRVFDEVGHVLQWHPATRGRLVGVAGGVDAGAQGGDARDRRQGARARPRDARGGWHDHVPAEEAAVAVGVVVDGLDVGLLRRGRGSRVQRLADGDPVVLAGVLPERDGGRPVRRDRVADR